MPLAVSSLVVAPAAFRELIRMRRAPPGMSSIDVQWRLVETRKAHTA